MGALQPKSHKSAPSSAISRSDRVFRPDGSSRKAVLVYKVASENAGTTSILTQQSLESVGIRSRTPSRQLVSKGTLDYLRHVFNSHQYQILRQQEELTSPTSSFTPKSRFPFHYLPRWSLKYLAAFVLAALVSIALVTRSLIHPTGQKTDSGPNFRPEFAWQWSPLEKGYYEGLRKLVSNAHPILGHGDSQGNKESAHKSSSGKSSQQYPEPFEYHPYRSTPNAGTSPTEKCFLDDKNDIPTPSVWAYSGVPEHAPEPMLGSHAAIGINKDVCFDRYGRYAAYGFGYKASRGGTGLGIRGDTEGTKTTLNSASRVDWRKVDLGRAQDICVEKNRHRFRNKSPQHADDVLHHTKPWPISSNSTAAQSHTDQQAQKHIPRTAVVLRLWDQYKWTNWSHLYIRSLISELNLNSGAEYDIHLLIQVKDGSPIWASESVYDEVLERVVPPEYRSLATLWSKDLMQLIYPGPFEPQFQRPGPIYSVGRSMHMALQWFAMHHPEYDFFWNWEMDLRYVGHWYELFDRVGAWAEQQPRRGAWERSGRFYIPSAHGDWDSFVENTEIMALNGSDSLVDGPQTFPGWEEEDRRQQFGDDYRDRFDLPPTPSEPSSTSSDGIGEPADYITFLPQFQPALTFWNIRADVSGYNTSLHIPPRRASIVTASRFSFRLLRIMHAETSLARHSMCGEMFPASMSLHHGLKALFAPHPMYFNRRWNSSDYIEGIFNSDPTTGQSGGNGESVFSEVPQHNFRGGTYYYDAGFAGRLWRRWLGYKEMGEGGARAEVKGSGRMCLRSVLLHPVKWEEGDAG